ncbi:hypothetical protein ACIBM4_05870 [Streptomyces sp. NPDC050256]|uniref:hypothetical protein n=1 Tax=Streptomyces sp. NPDC050256 TaxID=3365607 RepID=UPI0037A3398D
MPSHLAEVCRAGSPCPLTLAPPAGAAPSRTDVYRPEPAESQNGFLDVLSSTQTLILIAVLALGLLMTITWSNRRKAHAARKDAPPGR